MTNPAFLDENHLVRLRKLQIINPKIVIEHHIRDYNICQSYLNKTDTATYETMLYNTLSRIEHKLKRERLWRRLFDDYIDVYDDVANTVIRKVCNFNGGSLFSTWAYGIMKNSLLAFYRKRSKLQKVKLSENFTTTDLEITAINNLIVREYLSVLTNAERIIVIAIVFDKSTFKDLSEKFSKPVVFIKKIYKIAIKKVKLKITEPSPQ